MTKSRIKVLSIASSNLASGSNLGEMEKEVETPYKDKNGKEIGEFNLLRLFHFQGLNSQGRGRKNYYMYKWVKLVESGDKKHWVGLHLGDDSGDYFHLRTIADDQRIIQSAEIVHPQ